MPTIGISNKNSLGKCHEIYIACWSAERPKHFCNIMYVQRHLLLWLKTNLPKSSEGRLLVQNKILTLK